jgi:hypothetical protein
MLVADPNPKWCTTGKVRTDDDRFWAQVDLRCNPFEQARRDGSGTSIADFLVRDWSSDHNRILLGELLELELEYLDTAERDRDVEYYVVPATIPKPIQVVAPLGDGMIGLLDRRSPFLFLLPRIRFPNMVNARHIHSGLACNSYSYSASRYSYSTASCATT